MSNVRGSCRGDLAKARAGLVQCREMSSRLPPCLLLAGLLLAAAPAVAKPTIVVLAFGGEGGSEVRDSLVGPLEKKYEVLPGQQLLDACDQLGITMSRGKNLGAAAQQLGAVAVIGGTVKDGHLVLAVYSGKTGQPIGTGSVPCPGQLARPALAKALTVILNGLRKAPKKMPKPRRGGGASPAPQPLPEPKPKGTAGGSSGGTSGGALTFDPNAPDSPSGGTSSSGGSEEDPLAGAAPRTPQGKPVGEGETVTKKPPKPPGAYTPPKIQALVGLGSWIRNFSMNDPQGDPPPKYEAAAFTLRLSLVLFPAAFFTESWPAGFRFRLRYQEALGLKSQSKQPPESGSGADVTKTFGTTLREFVFDLGYDWNIFQKATGPHVELGLGYGMCDFGIDWEGATRQTMPATSYRFFLANIGARYDFTTWIGAHLMGEYRAMVAADDDPGHIEYDKPDATATDKWYGPSSTGGVQILAGLHSQLGGSTAPWAWWKGITATAEYSLTWYFFAFKDAEARAQAGNVKVAGGAIDLNHMITLNVGYTY